MTFIAAFFWNLIKGSWLTILKWVGVLGTILTIYFKGRSVGKKNEIDKQKDLTIDLQYRQNEVLGNAPKTDKELDQRLRDNDGRGGL